MKPLPNIIIGLLRAVLALALCSGGFSARRAHAADEEKHLKLSESRERLFDIPFYFATPETAWLKSPRLAAGGSLPSGDPVLRLPVKGFESSAIGLRLVVMRDSPEGRAEAAKKLIDAGLITDGDVILVFHPDWAHTMPYPHIQMGVSHAGTIFTDNGRAYNIDMPLDDIYNGENLTSQLNSEEYLSENTLHFVRARAFSEDAKRNLRNWVKLIRRDYAHILSAEEFPFNPDYLSPRYFALGISPLESAQRLGSAICAGDKAATPMKMFCSEFAWHLLTLSSISPKSADGNGIPVAQLRMIFSPKRFVGNGSVTGLADGPLRVLEALPEGVDQKLALIDELFSTGDAAELSAGHQAAALALKPQMDALRPYYRNQILRQAGRTPQLATDSAAEALAQSDKMPANYSPTSYLLNTLPATDSAERTFDYLFTLTFVSEEGYQKALKIAALQRQMGR